jgi:hypothetical protein
VERGFVYMEAAWPTTLQNCPESTLHVVETSTKPSDIRNDFGQQEERPLAEHYYKNGGAESKITMMQKRRRNPRMMSAKHRILSLKSPRCFANTDNNFEVVRPHEMPFLFRRSSSFFVQRQDSNSSCGSSSEKPRPRLQRSYTMPSRVVRFREENCYVYFDHNEDHSPRSRSFAAKLPPLVK